MAISNEAKIKVIIDGKEAQVSVKQLGSAISQSMKKGEGSVKALKSRFLEMGTIFKTAMAGYVLNDFVRASNEQEKAVAAFEQALRSMGRYSKEFSGDMQNMASQIQNEGIIGDEVLLRGAKFLATYKDIGNDVMPRAMKVMADFAALTGGDVASAANILGKASMGMTGEMARYGITLSETAKKSKDFNLILKEIEEQVGGQNKALAQTRAGSMQQFANAVGDLKEKGGDLIKIFIMPLNKLLTPLVNAINSMDHATLMMTGTLVLAAGTVVKVVIPAMRAFGVASKSAMGWVGAIIVAIELLYVAWDSNFLGIRDFLKTFWNFFKNFSGNVGAAFSALGDMIKGAVTLDFDRVKQGWDRLKELIVKSWTDAADKIEKETPKKYGKLGADAGEAFATGMSKNIENLESVYIRATARRVPQAETPGLPVGEQDTVEQVDVNISAFDRFMYTLNQTKLTGQAVFDTIQRGMQQTATAINAAMWGTRVDLKEVWKGIAQDFTQLFVEEVLRKITKVLVVKMLELLALFDVAANDRMAQRVGRDYARHFSKGVLDGLQKANLAGAMAGGGQGGGITVNLGTDRVYAAVNSARSRERVRRGNDINRENFR